LLYFGPLADNIMPVIPVLLSFIGFLFGKAVGFIMQKPII
jgi:hypothetical protein